MEEVEYRVIGKCPYGSVQKNKQHLLVFIVSGTTKNTISDGEFRHKSNLPKKIDI